jgi:predicted Fe-S protein YdhL (DUF1289 family)
MSGIPVVCYAFRKRSHRKTSHESIEERGNRFNYVPAMPELTNEPVGCVRLSYEWANWVDVYPQQRRHKLTGRRSITHRPPDNHWNRSRSSHTEACEAVWTPEFD